MGKAKPVIIKKYGNRRLYDTERSSYINLEEVATLLKKGRDVRIVDAKTEEDLTRTILLQLILERERNNISGFPVELLKELIILQDTPGRRWFDLSMRYSLELLRRMKRQTGFLRRPLEGVGMNPTGFFELLMGMGARDQESEPEARDQESEPGPSPKDAGGDQESEDPDGVTDEFASLQRRLAELEKKLGEAK